MNRLIAYENPLVERKLSTSGRMKMELNNGSYFGKVLSKVAGTGEWYNVQYEGEDDILTLNLHEDMDLGDLEVVS